jgi:putative ABC transport system substrate-binding protein
VNRGGLFPLFRSRARDIGRGEHQPAEKRARQAVSRTAYEFCLVFLLGLLAGPLAADAQLSGKVTRIGYLGDGSSAARAAISLEPFREGLRELGYIEGLNVILEVDVIVTHGAPGALAAKAATTRIPIVVAVAAEMVDIGLVASLARPGGNVTGISDQTTELSGKVVELLRETLPGLNSVGMLWNPKNPGAARRSEATETSARALGFRVRSQAVRDLNDIAEAFEALARDRVGAVVVVGDPLTVEHRTRIAQLALKKRLPTISATGMLTEAGGLMSYGANVPEMFRHAAVYVDKILKGARPADLAVQQPTKLELVVNLKTAKALGLTIPQSVLLRADEVIE